MGPISRRDFQLGLLSLGAASIARPVSAQSPDDDTRIAIIDTDDDIRKLIAATDNKPTKLGVEIVARYYSRKCQDGFAFKRFALNEESYVCYENRWRGPSEHDVIIGSGLSILSAYQFQSSDPLKFVIGLPDQQKRIQQSRKHPAEIEAEADAEAALDQAARVKQPPTAAIYFGVDFDLRDKGPVANVKGHLVRDDKGNLVDCSRALEGVLIYFSTLKSLVGDRIGAYGNGYTNLTLRQKGHTRFSWVSESRSFYQTPSYLSKTEDPNTWHVFQNQIDRHWFVSKEIDRHGSKDRCQSGLSLDTLVQNPNAGSIGAWNASGLIDVSVERTRAIYGKRWVATRAHIPVFDSDLKTLKHSLTCHNGIRVENSPERNRTVRIIRDLGDFVEVDIDDDGISDGFCQKQDPVSKRKNFVESIAAMPAW